MLVVKSIFTCVCVIQWLSTSVLPSGRWPGRNRSLSQTELSARLINRAQGFWKKNVLLRFVWGPYNLWMTGVWGSDEEEVSSALASLTSFIHYYSTWKCWSLAALVLRSWIPVGITYLTAFFFSCLSTSSFLLFLFVLNGHWGKNHHTWEILKFRSCSVLLVGIKLSCVCGWIKCDWNVCLHATGPVSPTFDTIVGLEESGISCRYWGKM